MRKQYLFACSLSVALALAAACGTSPVSPDLMIGAGAGSDGSTLKVSAPTVTSPTGDVRLDSLRPSMIVSGAAARFGSTPGFGYQFEVQNMAGTVVYTANATSTRHDMPTDLTLDTRYQWRARAMYQGAYGPWSNFGTFRTIDYRGIVPRPPDGRWPSTGPAVVAYVAAAFPQKLLPTPTDDERIVNMAWLRDRIIETGICGGMDLALNLKRGIGPHSIDAIAWRKPNGTIEVIDLAQAYDDKHIFLQLHFVETLGPQGYDPYPNHPGC